MPPSSTRLALNLGELLGIVSAVSLQLKFVRQRLADNGHKEQAEMIETLTDKLDDAVAQSRGKLNNE